MHSQYQIRYYDNAKCFYHSNWEAMGWVPLHLGLGGELTSPLMS